jgi:hypothetical protein
VDIEHFRRIWPQVLDALERDAPPTRGFLDGSRPAAVDAESLRVAVTSPMRADMLGRPENRERVAASVESVAGTRLRLEFEAGAPEPEPGAAAGAPAADGDTLLEEFKSMFNAVEESGG